FSQAIAVSAVGLSSGNTGGATGYTARVDYFENTADPILDEDGTVIPVNVPPDAADDQVSTDLNTPIIITVATDLLANDVDGNGDPISFAGFDDPLNGTLVDNGDGTLTYTPEGGFEGVDTFVYSIGDGTFTDSATVSVAVGNTIDVWYGEEQTFGTPGEAQTWINILGNVAGNPVSLSYSLNGGPAQALSVGPDTRRLQENGDFNIDIAYDALDGSAADDVVTIIANYAGGGVQTTDVVVNYTAGNTWNPNYSINWATVSSLQDVVQISDGTWTHNASGVRPVDLGYDRLLVIGDQSWDNYEVNLTIEMHDLENVDPLGRDGGAFAIGMLWNGHTPVISQWQPLIGYEPGAAFFYTERFASHSYHSFSEVLDQNNVTLDEGTTYNFTVRVEQVGIYDRLYSLKAWEVGTSEPVDWTVQGLETFSSNEAPATGGIYLNAHYYDVTFGDLQVTEIEGNDIVRGTAGADMLVATDQTTAGVGERDVFVGDTGADTFIFGEAGTVFYDDGSAATDGIADFGFVWDFESGIDKIHLAGQLTDYFLAENTTNLAQGSEVWLNGTGGDADELIGLVENVYGLDLQTDFTYSGYSLNIA
ncbi:MAG: Ig-like domain-containing protein, partial [Sulfitobacter sp.]